MVANKYPIPEQRSPQVRRHRPMTLIVVGTISLVASIALIRSYASVYRSASWPSTEGVIERIQVRMARKLQVDVAFKYSVGGREYHSNGFNPDYNTLPDDAANRRVIATYRAGDVHKVFYDPDDPSVSYLEPARLGHEYFVLGAVLGLMGLWALNAARTGWRRGQNEQS